MTELERAAARARELTELVVELRAAHLRACRAAETPDRYQIVTRAWIPFDRALRALDAARLNLLAATETVPAPPPPTLTPAQRYALAEKLFVDDDNEVRRWGRKAPDAER